MVQTGSFLVQLLKEGAQWDGSADKGVCCSKYKSEDLNLILGTYVKVESEADSTVILWPPHGLSGMWVPQTLSLSL